MAKSDSDKPIKPPSIGVLIAKVAAGVLFIATGFSQPDQSISYWATAIVLAAALIAWGILGYKNSQKQWEEHQASIQAQEHQRIRVCKVCGARSTGSVCEYCGSPLED